VTGPDTQPTLPADRAFVIQFRSAGPAATDREQGRAEHVVTGAATHFGDWHQLRAFVESILTRADEATP
jgi:hypothetical protein